MDHAEDRLDHRSTKVGCWDPALPQPGAVEIATNGTFGEQKFGLTGGPGADFNHAKIGVTISNGASGADGKELSIFGDMNQQGSLSGPNCGSSQNGRGGLFFVVDDPGLWKSVKALITCEKCDTAPEK